MSLTKSRRKFLSGGAAVLTGVTAGQVILSGCNSVRAASGGSGQAAAGSFGWEVSNFNGNGADAYFRVAGKMILDTASIDVAFSIVSLPSAPGLAEVLCQAAVSRGNAPRFDNSQGHAYLGQPVSTDFGAVNIYNPNGLAINQNSAVEQDLFFSVILKSWVPSDGGGSAASRNAFIQPSLALNPGDFLVFHMDHGGVPVDAEMQVVLGYTLG
jgi:hypothetical protein